MADLIADNYGYGVCPMKEDEFLEDEEISLLQSESIFALHLTQSQMFNAWENIQPNLQEIVKTFRGQ